MRNLLIPAGLFAGLVLASTAFAQTPATPAVPAKPAATSATSSKSADCEKAWSAEKKHTGTKTAFMKACMSKG